MRILFTRFPLESALGGAEIQTLSLMEGLMDRGHAVAFAGSCPVLLEECRKRHIPIASLDIGKPPVTKWGTLSFAWKKQHMKRVLCTFIEQFSHTDKTSKPDLDAIVMLSLSEKLLLSDVAAKTGIHVLWVEHDRIGSWLTKNPWLSLLRTQSAYATTITVSELSKKLYLALGWNPQKICAIPNGIHMPMKKGGMPQKNTVHMKRGNTIRIGCIARLSYEKGVDVLIDAMRHLPEDITLEIIGRGPEESSLKKRVRALGLDARVTFTPHEPDVALAYARFDILVLPSRDNDPFGMVAAEAMLAGLPVIVTDQCGIAGYLTPREHALIATANSSKSLSEQIDLLATDETLRLHIAQHGQTHARDVFSIKRMIDSYENTMKY